ncbi:MAG TPA: DUF4012 domain-containing protein [Patescibacteria group bacterium]
MSAPSHLTTKDNILIIDKNSLLGILLSENIWEDSNTILVSKKNPDPETAIIHIPFLSAIPTIPDGVYKKIVYFFDEETRDLIAPLLQKAKKDESELVIVVSHLELPLLKEVHGENEKNSKIVILGDIFGQKREEIDLWLEKIKKTKRIVLPNMGLLSWYPIYIKDCISFLSQIVLSQETLKKTTLIASPHPITQITLSHALQKVDPLIKIDFSKKNDSQSPSLPQGEVFSKEYNGIEAILSYYKDLEVVTDEKGHESSYFEEKENKKRGRIGVISFFFYSILVFLLMPVLLSLIFGLLGKESLTQSISDLKNGKIEEALASVKSAEWEISFSQTFLSITGQELSFVGKENLLDTPKNQLSFAKRASEMISEGLNSFSKLKNVISGTSQNPVKDISDASNSLQNILVEEQNISSENLPKEYKNQLSALNKYFPYIQTFINSLPKLISGQGNQTYLVVLQNNTELRPGGGFIGSYGLLKFFSGKFESFTIHDVYEADGQLKGHVEPSFAVRRYIPLVHLYLRDSNFDVDGVANAQKEAYMLEAETGERVDGVVSLDMSFVRQIVGVLGSLYVPEYNETVNADNFFMLTEKHAEKDSFAGSTQKRDFLSALSQSLIDKLNGRGISYEKLFESSLTGIEQKHLLFVSLDNSVQAPFSANGMSSALIDSRDDLAGVINDFLGINEANLGVDKVNYYIKRELAQKVLVSSNGRIDEALSLSLTNTSDGTWPGGEYKDYLQFILPKGTVINSISIDRQDQKIVPAVTDPKIYEAPRFVAPQGLEVRQTEENDKSIFSFLVTVPIKSAKNITLSYTLPTSANISRASEKYSLQFFKQPGVDDIPYTLEVGYPNGFGFLSSTQKATTTGSVVSITDDINKDSLIEVNWIKK